MPTKLRYEVRGRDSENFTHSLKTTNTYEKAEAYITKGNFPRDLVLTEVWIIKIWKS